MIGLQDVACPSSGSGEVIGLHWEGWRIVTSQVS